MKDSQVVTISFFEFKKWTTKWWAFTQMGLLPFRVDQIKGLQFFKQLGSGADNGFSIRPNFGVYGLLAVWENESVANEFLEKNKAFSKYQEHAAYSWTVFMRTTKVHGLWAGVTPFVENVQYNEQDPIAVITRATIYPKHVFEFWKKVPTVAESIEQQSGRIFSIGIGEWPIFMQATFSIWKNGKSMMAYAYKSQYHKEVVALTRKRGWYKEELFARFRPYKTVGEWKERVEI